MYLKGAGWTLNSQVVLYDIVHSSIHHRLEAEVSEVLGNKTYVGEEELEKLQYTEQVCLHNNNIIIFLCTVSWQHTGMG